MGLFLYVLQNLKSIMDQTERAFQKQPTVFLARKGGLKKSESRWVTSPGLGFKVPVEAREGHYVDKKCPFTGKCSIRGRILTGVIFTTSKSIIDSRRDTGMFQSTYHHASETSRSEMEPLSENADLCQKP